MRLYSVLGFFVFFVLGIFVAPYIIFIGVNVPIYKSLSGIGVSIFVLLLVYLGLLFPRSSNVKYDFGIEILRSKLFNIYLKYKGLHQLLFLTLIFFVTSFIIMEFQKYN